jgi:hypothetical protein
LPESAFAPVQCGGDAGGHTEALVEAGVRGLTGRAVMPRKQARGGERMAVVEYKRDDPGFRRWLRENPNGYVLNCYKTGKVHTALCRSYQSAEGTASS